MSRRKTNRRKFLHKTVQGSALATTGGLLWAHLLGRQVQAKSGTFRPPGAVANEDFNARCIKCGQCVHDCPYDTLSLATAEQNIPIGTPYFRPRDVPCYMCEDIPCVKACPTGALNPELTEIERAKMGLAVIDIEHCLSWLGLRCEICHRDCPAQGRAITVEHHPRKISRHAMFVPLVQSEACTGCGICEKVCPTAVAAIRIVAPSQVQGRIGDHYRLGWKSDTEITQEFTPRASPVDKAAPATGLDYLNADPLQ